MLMSAVYWKKKFFQDCVHWLQDLFSDLTWTLQYSSTFVLFSILQREIFETFESVIHEDPISAVVRFVAFLITSVTVVLIMEASWFFLFQTDFFLKNTHFIFSTCLYFSFSSSLSCSLKVSKLLVSSILVISQGIIPGLSLIVSQSTPLKNLCFLNCKIPSRPSRLSLLVTKLLIKEIAVLEIAISGGNSSWFCQSRILW